MKKTRSSNLDSARWWAAFLVRRLATPHRKGVALMVTYEGLFAFCMLIVSIIALFQSNKK